MVDRGLTTEWLRVQTPDTVWCKQLLLKLLHWKRMKKPMGAHQNKCLKKPSKLVNVTNLNKIFSKFLKTCFVSSRPASRVLDAGVEPVSGGRDRDRLHLQGGPLQRGRPQQGRI